MCLKIQWLQTSISQIQDINLFLSLFKFNFFYLMAFLILKYHVFISQVCIRRIKEETLFLQYNSYQHSCSQIKFMEELSNKDVHFQHICDIISFYIPQYINKPFKCAMSWADPQEIYLLKLKVGILIKNSILKL